MLILASASPRRREILKSAGYDFKIMPADADENISDISPEERVKALALRKAMAVKDKVGEGDVILAADTLVFLGDKILGKPRDLDEAFLMLSSLSGTTHRVITGLAVIKGEKIISDSVETKVIFKRISPEAIAEYIASSNPLDKAGAYGIQETGDEFVDHFEGDYNNVVGLPLFRVEEILKTI